MSRSRRTWIIFALLLAAIAVAGLAYRSYETWQQRRTAFAVHQDEEAALQPLRTTIYIKIDRRASMREWLAEFTRQTGVAAEALPIDFDTYDGKTRELIRQFDDTFHVNIELPPSRARDLLDTVALTHDVHWKLRPDGSVEFGWPNKQESVVARHYPLPIDLTPAELATLQGLLGKYLEYNRHGVRLDGVARVYSTPGGCSMVQSLPVHLDARRFLDQCLTAIRMAEDPSTQHMLANLSHCPHTWLHIEEATIREVEAALDRPITLSAVDMPWPDFAAELSRQASFPVALTANFAKRIAEKQPNLTCRMKNVPLRQLAGHVTLPSFHPILPTKLALFPAGNGRALLIGEHREDASADRHHHLCAYPVSDLTTDAQGVSHTDELESVILGATDGEWGTFHLGNYKMNFFLNGELMVVSQRLEVQRRIQRLLTALRRVRGGEVGSLAVTNSRPPQDVQNGQEESAQRRAELSRSVTLQYNGVRLPDIVQDLRDRTDMRIMPSSEVHDQWITASPVWCYLPKRPLGDNFRILFQACGYKLIEQSDQCRVMLTEPIDDGDRADVCEVFDLRPWLNRLSSDGHQLSETIPRMMGQRNWSGRLDEFRELLVINCRLGEMQRVKEILERLNEFVGSAEDRRWRGELISGDRLNQPLTLWEPPENQTKSEQALIARLEKLAHVNFNQIKIADALLTLASRHELPLVVQELAPGSYGLQHVVSYHAEDKPLRNILQELIGNPPNAHWQALDDAIRLTQDKSEVVENDDNWYAVHDLLRPEGLYQPNELLNLLRPAMIKGLAQDIERDPPLQLYLGKLLMVRNAHVSRGALEKLLCELRNREAQP